MKKTEFFMPCHDGHEINVYKWVPEDEENIKGIFQIVHGSIEHADRYHHFASYLVENGYVVYADDHRGHGKTADRHKTLGFFSDQPGGFDLLVKDLSTLNNKIRSEYPDHKIVMFGHSMGSFMTRYFIKEYADQVGGAIICGTVDSPVSKSMFGLGLAGMDIRLNGRKNRSKFLNDQVYGSLNKNIKNARTGSDFISKDETVVDKYLNDPHCGYLATSDYIYEMIWGLKEISKKESFIQTPNHLPLFIISGEEDPCGGNLAKGVRNVHSKYRQHGSEDATINIYVDARHEILNEKINTKVYKDIVDWAEARF